MGKKQFLFCSVKSPVSNLYETRVNTGNLTTSINKLQEVDGNITTQEVKLDTNDALSDLILSTTDRLSWQPWEGKIYFCNKDVGVYSIVGKSAYLVNTTDLPNAADYTKATAGYREVKAKYCCNSDGHLMLANCVVNGTEEPLFITWSDLYDPDNFEESSSSEGGYYIIQASDVEITGLVFCRGYTNILTRSGVWQARYVGYSAGLFEFNNISNSAGCNFHHSAIAAKDAVFYAGKDNFYVIDGGTVSPIGTDVWKVFIDALLKQDTDLPGFLDEDNDVVYWKFVASGEHGTTVGELHDLLYNYKEQKWAIRNADGVVDVWQSNSDVTIGITCDELNVACSYFTGGITPQKCNEFVREFSYSKLFMSETAFLLEDEANRAGVDGDGRNLYLETKDFAFSSTDSAVCIEAVRLLCQHNKMLGTDAAANGAFLKLQLGCRANLSDTIRWSEEVSVASWGTDEKELLFRFRAQLMTGKFFRLRVLALQKGDSYIKTISAVQFNLDVPKALLEVTR